MTAAVLSNRVLVLSVGWQPINVTTALHAFCKVYNGRATIVEDYVDYDIDEWVLTWDDAALCARNSDREFLTIGENARVAVPEIIKCVYPFKRKAFKVPPRLCRATIFARDKNRCQYCGRVLERHQLNIDHVVPKGRGGGATWTNLVLSCIECNDRKKCRTPEEAGMRLIRKPVRPPPGPPRRRLRVGKNRPASWEAFLSAMYWNVSIED